MWIQSASVIDFTKHVRVGLPFHIVWVCHRFVPSRLLSPHVYPEVRLQKNIQSVWLNVISLAYQTRKVSKITKDTPCPAQQIISFELSPLNFLPWNISDWDYPPVCKSSDYFSNNKGKHVNVMLCFTTTLFQKQLWFIQNHTDIENFKLQALFSNQSKSTFNFNINMPLTFDLLLTF